MGSLSSHRVGRWNISIPFLRPFLLYAGFRYHFSCTCFLTFPPSPSLVLAINTVRCGAIYKTEHLTTAPAFSLLRANYRAVSFCFFHSNDNAINGRPFMQHAHSLITSRHVRTDFHITEFQSYF